MANEQFNTAVMYFGEHREALAPDFDLGERPELHIAPEVPHSDTTGLTSEMAALIIEVERDAFIGEQIAADPDFKAYLEAFRENGYDTTDRKFRRKQFVVYNDQKTAASRAAQQQYDAAFALAKQEADEKARLALEATLAEQLRREEAERQEAAEQARLAEEARLRAAEEARLAQVAARQAIEATRLAAERAVARQTIDAYKHDPQLKVVVGEVFQSYTVDELADLYAKTPEKLLKFIESRFEPPQPELAEPAATILPLRIIAQFDPLLQPRSNAEPSVTPKPVRAVLRSPLGLEKRVELGERSA